jgi:hypothetical protein
MLVLIRDYVHVSMGSLTTLERRQYCFSKMGIAALGGDAYFSRHLSGRKSLSHSLKSQLR